MESKPIEELEREYGGNWLLIQVTKTDKRNDEPLEGVLLAHSPSRQTISEARRGVEGDILITWAGDLVAEGYCVVGAECFLLERSSAHPGIMEDKPHEEGELICNPSR